MVLDRIRQHDITVWKIHTRPTIEEIELDELTDQAFSLFIQSKQPMTAAMLEAIAVLDVIAVDSESATAGHVVRAANAAGDRLPLQDWKPCHEPHGKACRA